MERQVLSRVTTCGQLSGSVMASECVYTGAMWAVYPVESILSVPGA